MSSRIQYAPVSGDHDGQDSEAYDFHDEIPSPSEGIGEERTWLRCVLILSL